MDKQLFWLLKNAPVNKEYVRLVAIIKRCFDSNKTLIHTCRAGIIFFLFLIAAVVGIALITKCVAMAAGAAVLTGLMSAEIWRLCWLWQETARTRNKYQLALRVVKVRLRKELL